MTLTELNYTVRKFAPIAVIFLLVFVMLFLAVQLLLLYVNSQKTEVVQGPPPAVIDATFNKLQPPIIPQATSSSKYTYVLDTLDGTPNIEYATNAATIYFIPEQAASFGSLPKVTLMAKDAGFDTEITQPKVSDNTANFDDGKRKMSIDMKNFNFNFDYVLTPEDVNLDGINIPAENELLSQASNFLSRLTRYPTELAQGKKNIIYLNYNAQNNQIATLDSSTGANMAEIDYYRPDLNSYPLVTSTYYNSPHYVVFGFSQEGLRIVRAQVKFFEHSTDQTGIYPIRTAEIAWQDLQQGRGKVVSSTKDSGEIVIKKIFLAYYDPDVYQQYLQPVYVFLGDDKFVAYVTAVTDEYLLPE
ncbi:MAG TPA: hypothetical protein PLS49_01100 [Candidatus Woesebacteria bacterium]|nr:hypothetical protein [Candidatus Woesebacteria bacterium]